MGAARTKAVVWGTPKDRGSAPHPAKQGSGRAGRVRRELVEQTLIVGADTAPGGDQVRPERHGAVQGLGTAPALDPPVVPGPQHVRNCPAPVVGRLGVVRVLEQTVAER